MIEMKGTNSGESFIRLDKYGTFQQDLLERLRSIPWMFNITIADNSSQEDGIWAGWDGTDF